MPRALKNLILQVYFLLRLPFIWLLKILFKAPAGEPGRVSRILLIRLDRLGDFILSLPVIDSLRQAYPSAKIDVMVRPYLTGLAGMVPAVNEVLVYSGIVDALRSLPNRKYDIAIDMLCDYKIEPAIVALSSKAPVRIGFKGGFREAFFTHAVYSRKGSSKSMVDIGLELLTPMGIMPRVTIPKLAYSLKPKDAGTVIAVHPGGHYASQRWGFDRFASLVNKLAERYNFHILVIGGAGDRDEVKKIMEAVKGKDVEAIFPDLKELVRILSGCSLLVCNNSGPLHLAAALGVPTVSMMGPTDPALWWPKGEVQTVIRKGLKCSPCLLGQCGEHLCMDLITVDEVFNEARRLLEKNYGHEV